MKSFIFITFTVLILFITGCADEGDDPFYSQACTDTTAEEEASDVSPALAANPDADIEDSVNAIDLVGTPTSEISGTTLTCVLTVFDIPEDEQLLVYHDELTQGAMNYQWAVKFDIDSDNDDDYVLALTLMNGTLGEQPGNLNTLMQANLWDATGTTTSTIADAELTINSLTDSLDSITLVVTDDAVANLVGAPEVYAATMMNNGLENYSDCRQISTGF